MTQSARMNSPFWPWDHPLGTRAWDTDFHARDTKFHAEKACIDGGPVFDEKAVFASNVHGREDHSGISNRSQGEVK